MESQPGQGSLFYFTLPVAPQEKTPMAGPLGRSAKKLSYVA